MSEIRTNCSICSLACPLVLRDGRRSPIFTGESILSLDWDDSEDSKYGGSLCARGAAIVEFVVHPDRVNYPTVLGERTSYAAALEEAAKSLTAIREEAGGDAIAVLLGENLTAEEAALARRFAEKALETENIALIAPDDVPMFRAYLDCDLSSLSPAGGRPEGERRVYLMFGDPFSEHPCTAKDVLAGKNSGRGNEIIAVGPEKNHTAWFAGRHLACNPGGDTAVAAGLLKAAAAVTGSALVPPLKKLVDAIEWKDIERIGGVSRDDIEEAAGSMLGAAHVETYVSNLFGRFGDPTLTSVFAEALTRICPGESRYEPQFVLQNTWGIYSSSGAGNPGKVLEKIGGGKIQALVLLGLDLFSVYPASPIEKALRDNKFTVATQLFRGQTAERANVVIPAAALVEKKGTVQPSFDEEIERADVIDPIGGTVSDERFLLDLARKMGVDLEAGKAESKASRSSCEDFTADWAAYSERMRALDNVDTVLIPWSEAVHVADGSLSRNFLWSRITCPEPYILLSKEYADEAGISGGDLVAVSSDGGETVLEAKVTDKLSGRTVAAPVHFPAVRRLFPWNLDERHGEIRLGPVPVELSRQSEKS